MSGEPEDQDHHMAAQLKRGDSTAIESLYDRYGRLAYGLAFRILNDRSAAEDAVQDAFLAVWRKAAGFDTSRGSLRNWLLSIVRNRTARRPPSLFSPIRPKSDSETGGSDLKPCVTAPGVRNRALRSYPWVVGQESAHAACHGLGVKAQNRAR